GGLAPLRQPGGDRAAREPWRMGAAALHALGREDEIEGRFGEQESAAMLSDMLDRELNAPLTSSAGRLFDAACGILGMTPVVSFEGEAAMHLEALVDKPEVMPDGWRINDTQLDFLPLLDALCSLDTRAGANLFHGTLAAGFADFIATEIENGVVGGRRVAASGGCIQNAVLTQLLRSQLARRHIDLVLPSAAPANDGGLSLGQAWIAALHAENQSGDE
ncbi:MAG: hypothetical protein AAGH38_02695, partial [Pseudomonadota bacterium]